MATSWYVQFTDDMRQYWKIILLVLVFFWKSVHVDCKWKKFSTLHVLYVGPKKFITDVQICFCLSLGSAIYDRLYSALTNNALVKGIMQASPLAQTSCLEGFHSVLNQFAPKMIA